MLRGISATKARSAGQFVTGGNDVPMSRSLSARGFRADHLLLSAGTYGLSEFAGWVRGWEVADGR